MKIKLLKRLRNESKEAIYVQYNPLSGWYELRINGRLYWSYDYKEEAIRDCIAERRLYILSQVFKRRGNRYYKIF